jgi:TerC family integral membrane protein
VIGLYLGFIALVLGLLALDLGVFNRHAHVIRSREALAWSALWIGLGLAFAGLVYLGYDHHWLGLGTRGDQHDGASAVAAYLTGFTLEKSLAIDNLFVIALIFGAFAVPPRYQHRVLFWGVVGALVLRGAMIALGATLLTHAAWIIYVFGAFLIVTGIRMMRAKGGPSDPRLNPVVRWVARVLRVTTRFHGRHFLVRAGAPASREPATPGGAAEHDAVVAARRPGAWLATPLLLALVMVELTDVVFAVDSIPAIFAVTTDPFLVFTSNVFALLGMRSLYFALAGMVGRFRYLEPALALVLVVVGTKMLAHDALYHLFGAHFDLYLLGAVLAIIGTAIALSMVATRGRARSGEETAAGRVPDRGDRLVADEALGGEGVEAGADVGGGAEDADLAGRADRAGHRGGRRERAPAGPAQGQEQRAVLDLGDHPRADADRLEPALEIAARGRLPGR